MIKGSRSNQEWNKLPVMAARPASISSLWKAL